MPSVLPDAVVTNAATPVTINVLANDTGTGMTITSFSNPANGSLVFNGDKTFTYTPMAGFIGDDSFAYTVRDAQGTPANAEVTISVIANTGATVATDDVVEVIAGGSVIIPVLANDMAAGGGTLQIIAVSMPGHGVVNVLSDQTIRYVPQSGFAGIDSFNYTVVDGQGSSASATVTVKVLTENSPPIAGDDTFTIEAGQPTMLVILANDSDPDGGPLQVVGFTMPSHGKLVFNPDKTFTFTPTAGYLGNDQFTYTIRDNRGASALASVTLIIAEVNEAPTAYDDQVTTEAGVPATIDVLANDTVPAGQAISIIAVTLPYRGKLVFNPDKTISYTPNAGFVGIDDFTYTISNGKGGTAKATVTIEVTSASSADVYANGYAYRRRLAIPASSAKGSSHANFPLWVELAGNWLKSTANDGKVASADGHDLRFELEDGTKLAHELEHYDAVAGKLGAWVRLPELKADAATVLLLYYGNPEVAESETAPQAVWQDYLAVWHLPGVADATSAGRTLTAQGSVAASTEGLGLGALALDGNGVLTIADASWLSDHSALSVQLRSKASSIGTERGQLVAGVEAFTGNGDLFIRYQTTGFATTKPKDVIHSSIGTTAGKFRVSSKADTQSISWQSLTLAWQSGDTEGSLHLDGKKIQPSYTTTNADGGTTLVGGPLYIGASTQDSATGGWVGLIDEVRFRAARLSDAWIDVEYTNQTAPAFFYGLGAEDAFGDSSESIVAVPFQRTTPAGESIDIDVLTDAVGPQSGGMITIQGVDQPANGVASIFGNQVRYSPYSSFVGMETFTYTLAANGKTSTATIAISVRSSVPNPQGDSAEAELPAAVRTVSVSSNAQLISALSSAQPGDHIVLANGTYSGTFTTSVSGTAANPIVIRAANLLSADISGRIVVNHPYSTVHGLNFTSSTSAGNVRIAADDARVLRCSFTMADAKSASDYTAVEVDTGYKRAEVAYNRTTRGYFAMRVGLAAASTNPAKLNHHFHHNHWKDAGANPLEIGSSWQSSATRTGILIEYNLVENCGNNSSFACKSSENTYFRNTILNCGKRVFQARHGRSNKFIANACINSAGILARGFGHEVIGNYKDAQYPGGNWSDIGAPTGTVRQADFEVNNVPSGTQWPAGDNSLYLGNLPTSRIGGGSSVDTVFPTGNRVESATSSWTLVSGRHVNTTTGTSLSQSVPPYVILKSSDVGPLAD